MDLACDLHLHSAFSIATSPRMLPGPILLACRRKGLGAVGSGDALLPGWRAAWERCRERGSGTLVVPSAEVEDRDRIHHLILMEDFSGFASLQEAFSVHSRDLLTTGRPRVRLSGEEIARSVHARGGLVGPAHAFTPWTSLYARYDTPAGAYGAEPVDFLELGLSADSSYGAAVPELYAIPFLSHSDAHSPDPASCGREFSVLSVREVTVPGVLEAISRGGVVMNAGLFPEEGKYNRTACSRCYRQFGAGEAAALSWRCPDDGGRIKKGVLDRSRELSTGAARTRPPYLHTIPLVQVIQRVLGVSSPRTRGVQALYDRFLDQFGDEIRVLAGAAPGDLAAVHPGVAGAVRALREGRVLLTAGGGGRYGSFAFP
jgi:uncharacterized protein (TIGR00375 family)